MAEVHDPKSGARGTEGASTRCQDVSQLLELMLGLGKAELASGEVVALLPNWSASPLPIHLLFPPHRQRSYLPTIDHSYLLPLDKVLAVESSRSRLLFPSPHRWRTPASANAAQGRGYGSRFQALVAPYNSRYRVRADE